MRERARERARERKGEGVALSMGGSVEVVLNVKVGEPLDV